MVDGQPRQTLAGLVGVLQAAGAEEVIIDPHSYRLLGHDHLGRPSPGSAVVVENGVAYLRAAVVSGPGVMP